jgi:hypothetical protein
MQVPLIASILGYMWIAAKIMEVLVLLEIVVNLIQQD